MKNRNINRNILILIINGIATVIMWQFQIGRYIIYPWRTIAAPGGTPGGHRIYIELLRETKNSTTSYSAKISDLGYGRTGELGDELKPIQLKFQHKETFDLYIHFLTSLNRVGYFINRY